MNLAMLSVSEGTRRCATVSPLGPYHHYPRAPTHCTHGGRLPVHPGTPRVTAVTTRSPGSFWYQRVGHKTRSFYEPLKTLFIPILVIKKRLKNPQYGSIY